MQRSISRILTTHTGSLPRPADLVAMLNAKELGEPYDKAAFAARVKRAIAEVVRQQVDTGIDVVGDGEHSKFNWMAYARARLSGLKEIDSPVRFRGATRDSIEFAGAYEDLKIMHAARSGALVAKRTARPKALVCAGADQLCRPGRAAGRSRQPQSGAQGRNVTRTSSSPRSRRRTSSSTTRTTTTSPTRNISRRSPTRCASNISRSSMPASCCRSTIRGWRRTTTARSRRPIEDCRKFIALRVEALNHALRGIPEDQIRFHTCYSVNIAPRVHDFELKHFVDLMLQVRAAAFVIEAANPRHEHEWQVWEEVKLPDDKILIPGVVSHCVHLVEHPELVAQRIVRFADVVGRERVIAGTDCGFGTSGAGDEVHPDVAWAKLKALVEGARIASRKLWG